MMKKYNGLLSRDSKILIMSRVLNFISLILPKYRKNSLLATPKRVGVILQWGLGDAILAMPLLGALRERYPNSSIELIGKPFLEDLFSGVNYVNKVHVLVPPWVKHLKKYWFWKPEWWYFVKKLITLRKECFDLGICIRYDPREIIVLRILNFKVRAAFGASGGRHWLDIDLKNHPHRSHDGCHVREDAIQAAKILCDMETIKIPSLSLPKKETQGVLNKLRNNGYVDGKILAVCNGAQNPIRRWSEEKFSQVLSKLSNQISFFVIISDPAESVITSIKPPQTSPHIFWRSSLHELRALLSITDILLACDGGIMHLASSCGSHIAGIFGPTKVEWFGTTGKNDEAVMISPMPCRPCYDHCVRTEIFCMTEINVDSVVSAVESILEAIKN